MSTQSLAIYLFTTSQSYLHYHLPSPFPSIIGNRIFLANSNATFLSVFSGSQKDRLICREERDYRSNHRILPYLSLSLLGSIEGIKEEIEWRAAHLSYRLIDLLPYSFFLSYRIPCSHPFLAQLPLPVEWAHVLRSHSVAEDNGSIDTWSSTVFLPFIYLHSQFSSATRVLTKKDNVRLEYNIIFLRPLVNPAFFLHVSEEGGVLCPVEGKLNPPQLCNECKGWSNEYLAGR